MEDGLTKATIINSLKFILFWVSCCFITSDVWAIRLQDNLALYGDAKYPSGFQHFDFVNPKAPKQGSVTLPAYGTFDSFNPFIFKGIAASDIVGLIFDTLGVVPNDDYTTVYPLIAEKFEFPEDMSYVGFVLNPKAKFSDGSPVTADDVIFSFNSLIEKGAPLYRIYYADVENVKKINNHHVRFYFRKDSKNKELPLILSQLAIFSKKDWEGKDFAKPSLVPPLTSGPYVINKFEPNKFIELKRNKDYWAKDLPSRKGIFNFDTVRYDYYQDTTVTLQALFAGNLDLREEYIAKNWATGYNNNLVKQGKIIKAEIPNDQTAILQNFAFNLRKPKFQNKLLRQALTYTFDFDWANKKLFYNQYKRLNSYYSNSEMEAKGKPQGKELAILNKYKKDLPPEVFGNLPEEPHFLSPEDNRKNLLKAVSLLRQAGYDFVNGKMTNLKTNQPLTIEILSNNANGSTFTRVMLPFLQNLRKIGIDATFRNLEVNIFKNRLDNFDFDMAIVSFPMSNMPGNEQKEMWGSQSADVKGSYNIIGVKNPVVDSLLNEMIQAHDKETYIATLKALDRVLRHNYYMIPQWYSSYKRIAYNPRLDYPKSENAKGFQPYTWWVKEPKNKKEK